MVIFHTFENRVILLPINVLLPRKLFLPYNKFEMILESIETILDMIIKVNDFKTRLP